MPTCKSITKDELTTIYTCSDGNEVWSSPEIGIITAPDGSQRALNASGIREFLLGYVHTTHTVQGSNGDGSTYFDTYIINDTQKEV